MRYRKHISIQYEYVDSASSEEALAEVFDGIFMKLAKRQQRELYTNFSLSTVAVFSFVLEHRDSILTIN